MSEKYLKDLNVAIGKIPHEINFPNNHFDAILAARVLQYLMPRNFISALKKFKKWLKPQGKLFIIVKTPYIKLLHDFIPVYKQRKLDGKRWPGVIKNLHKYNDDTTISHVVPQQIHVLDKDILIRSCKEVGFKVLKCDFINRHDFPVDIKCSGKEEVGIILKKI